MNKGNSNGFLEAIKNQHYETVKLLLNKFGVEHLGGNQVWNKALKLSKKNNNEKIMKLLIQANSTEIIREGINTNLRLIYQFYQELREKLGQSEFICLLIQKHGFYGKSKQLIDEIKDIDPDVLNIFDGIDSKSTANQCSEEFIHSAETYREFSVKLMKLFEHLDDLQTTSLENSELDSQSGPAAANSLQKQNSSSSLSSELKEGGSENSEDSFSQTFSDNHSESNDESNSTHSSDSSSGTGVTSSSSKTKSSPSPSISDKRSIQQKDIENKLDAILKKLENKYPPPPNFGTLSTFPFSFTLPLYISFSFLPSSPSLL